MAGNVKVCARFRPQNAVERSENGQICVQLQEDQVKLTAEDGTDHKFNFDRVFGMDTAQKDVFEYAALPVITDVLDGYNGTIFAYGQTGSGKTHTMEGPSIDDVENCGLIPRLIFAVFEGIANSDPVIEYQVMVQYVEIYMERVRDLLDPNKSNLQVREDKTRGIYIQDCTQPYVTCAEDMFNYMKIGAANRAVGATRMNEGSSRSHSIFLISVLQKNSESQSTKQGRLFLVDLAGSEMIKKTQAEGARLEEAKTINKSLSALGNVINSLTENREHVPYRDSKLTRILQQSLGGNSKTTLIICMSSSSYNAGETLSTLRFGTRAKSVKNNAKKNEEKSAAELQAMLHAAEGKIRALESKVRKLQGGEELGEDEMDDYSTIDPEMQLKIEAKLEQLREDLEEKKMEIDALTEMLVEKESVLDEWESGNTVRLKGQQQAAHTLQRATTELLEYAANFQGKLAGQPVSVESVPLGEGEEFELQVGGLAKTIESTVSGLSLQLMQVVYEKEQLVMDKEAHQTELGQLRSELEKQRTAAPSTPAPTTPGTSAPAADSEEAAAAQVALSQSSEAIRARIQALEASLQAAGEETVESTVSPSVEPDEDDGVEEEEPELDLASVEDSELRGTAEQLQSEVRKLRFELSKGNSKIANKTRHFEQQRVDWAAKQELLETQRKLLEEELQAVNAAVQQQQLDAEKLTGTLKNDLNAQVERYLALRMEVEEARVFSPSVSPSPDKKEGKERAKVVQLQRKLDSVTADHQWLLTQYVTVNSQNAEVRKKEQLALEHIKNMEQEIHRRQSKQEDETARLMAEASQAHARELQALAKLQEAKAEIAQLLSQKMKRRPSDDMTAGRPRGNSMDNLGPHVTASLSGGQVHSPGNFAPVPIRGGGGMSGITNLTDRQNTSAAASGHGAPAEAAAPAETKEKKPNFFKRLFS